MIKLGINGFGRIGRLAYRIALLKHSQEVQIVAVNTSGSMDTTGWAHLVNYDSTYRKFEYEVVGKEIKKAKEATDVDPLIGELGVSERAIKTSILAQRDPAKIPWAKYGVDVVIESTGHFTDEEGAKKHSIGGAKRVIISAPGKGENVKTYVLGVNPPSPKALEGQVVVLSNASCTTNCVAPVAAVMHAAFGIEKAMMTTVHSYTDDQNLQDGSHKDLRRARGAAVNIVPTSTGAAVATTETIPELKGIFDGVALRVPVATGSLTDFTFVLKRDVTVEDVNKALLSASTNPIYKGILTISEENLVSSDIIGRSESAIVDLPLTQVVAGNMVKIFAWYDNEWGYANRLVEQAIRVGNSLSSDTAPTDPITITHNSQAL
jgi:glyceraldehyde 3-phosphate dehydrogenase